MSLLRPSSLVLALCLGVTAIGCDLDEGDPAADAVAFENGVAKDTDGGAFRVVLNSRSGLVLGDNDIVVHVGFHEPSDPTGAGKGIPNADVRLLAHNLDTGAQTPELSGSYLGDGRYEFNGIELSEAGAWSFELAIEAGETIDESVAFVFDVVE